MSSYLKEQRLFKTVTYKSPKTNCEECQTLVAAKAAELRAEFSNGSSTIRPGELRFHTIRHRGSCSGRPLVGRHYDDL
jgi:hypothetical protein